MYKAVKLAKVKTKFGDHFVFESSELKCLFERNSNMVLDTISKNKRNDLYFTTHNGDYRLYSAHKMNKIKSRTIHRLTGQR